MKLRQEFLSSGAIGVESKDDRSPVTAADLASHKVLDGGLASVLDLPVVSEEGSGRETGDAFWLIDPLDGTKEFLKGRDEWTVNVALVQNGRAVAGMVTAPVLNEAWWGVPGEGASSLQNGSWEPISCPPLQGRDCRVVASTSHRGPDVDRYVEALAASGYQVSEHSYGSSLKICRVAEGAADVYPRLGPTMHWDTAAANAVLLGAGGTLTDLEGLPLRYGHGDWRNPHFIAGAPGTDWTQFAKPSTKL